MIPYQSHRLTLDALAMLGNMDRDPGPAADWLAESGIALFDAALLFGQGADLRQKCNRCDGIGLIDPTPPDHYFPRCETCTGTGKRPVWRLPQATLATWVECAFTLWYAGTIREFSIEHWHGNARLDTTAEVWQVVGPVPTNHGQRFSNGRFGGQLHLDKDAADRELRRRVLGLPLFVGVEHRLEATFSIHLLESLSAPERSRTIREHLLRQGFPVSSEADWNSGRNNARICWREEPNAGNVNYWCDLKAPEFVPAEPLVVTGEVVGFGEPHRLPYSQHNV